MNIERLHAAGAARHAQEAPADSSYGVFAQIPDMINGDADAFHQIHIAAGVDQAFFWPKDTITAAFVPIRDSASLRAHVLQEATLYANRMAALVPDDAKRYAFATLLAWFRVASRRAWGFAERHCDNNQTFTVPAGAVPDDTGVIAADIVDFGTVDEVIATWVGCAAWYDANIDTCLKKLLKVAIGTPVCNGVVIVATGIHHFVDPHKQVMRVMMRQAFMGEDMTMTVISIQEFEDLAFHKGFHPIRAGYLMWMARNPEMKPRLAAIGLASAGVRTPALFQPERAMSAYKALVLQTAELSSEYNVALGKDHVMTVIEGIAMPEPISSTGIAAMADAVQDFTAAHGYSIAFCAGLMAAVAEDLPRGLNRISILNSHSVQRIMRENPVSVAAGENHYRLVKRWTRARANAGALPGIGLFGTAPPADRGSPDP